MSIKTHIAPMYGGQKIFAALLCAVFGLWGVYDYGWSIPARQRHYDAFQQRTEAKKELESRGSFLTQDEQQQLAQINEDLKKMSPDGKVPTKPGAFDRAIQWAYIACLPFTPWFLWMFVKAKRQRYELDDEGTLHFAGDPEHGSGTWKQEEIADIDMDRWMAKSIAFLVHTDGTRLKLDAYIHKNLHLIIGDIASRMYPEQWDAEAKQVKNADSAGESDADDQSDEPVTQATSP